MGSAKQNFAADITALKGQLSDVLATLAALANAAREGERGSFTLKEFQRRHRLSESQFFREGRGPRLMAVGAVGKRVSLEAERDWVAVRETEAEAAKEATQTENEPGDPGGPAEIAAPKAHRGPIAQTNRSGPQAKRGRLWHTATLRRFQKASRRAASDRRKSRRRKTTA
jgi:hypothetical protein